MHKDPNLTIRLERARSWISMAEAEQQLDHARFVFYWIAFNSMYGLPPIDPDHLDKEPESQRSEIRKFLGRVKDMLRYDRERMTGILDNATKKCLFEAKALIEDPFLSYEYWEAEKSPPHVERACKSDWEHADTEFRQKGQIDSILNFSFYGLTVLRNQVLHGSATATVESKGFNSLLNGVRFLKIMVPALYELLESHGGRIRRWPRAPYPRRGHIEHPHF